MFGTAKPSASARCGVFAVSVCAALSACSTPSSGSSGDFTTDGFVWSGFDAAETPAADATEDQAQEGLVDAGGTPEADAAADAGADADVASDADTVADADTVSDVDTAADADTVSDVDAAADADSVADLDTAADADGVADVDTTADGDMAVDIDAVSDADTGWNPVDTESDAGWDASPDAALPPGYCNERTQQVYVSTQNMELLQFQPDLLTFKLVGPLDCPAEYANTPFSMAIDHDANAWVLYSSGELFQVSTLDASCQATGYLPGQQKFITFGMGFASDGVGSPAETLYIANTTGQLFGKISFPDLVVTKIGILDGGFGSPELTGNGLAELWGYFPSSSPPSVRQIDKVSGKSMHVFPIEGVDMSSVNAWAFAAWGGQFYIFYRGAGMASSQVWQLDPVTGEAKLAIANTGYVITGAGVSSCAPTQMP
ncbi:MAG: hypothetical protein ACOYOB_03625 [Myxococcota bacterium]